MKPDISEFSYGYVVTEALVRGFGTDISAAPVFPSLVAEGREGGGYDVRIEISGIPLFLQFKLSDYMKRNRANEVRRVSSQYRSIGCTSDRDAIRVSTNYSCRSNVKGI